MKISNFVATGILAVLSFCWASGQTSTLHDDLNKAKALAEQGKTAEASAVYTEIMGKYPDNRDAVQGWLMLNMKKSPTGEEDAIAQLETLGKSFPQNTGIMFFKAFIEAEYKHFDAALATTEKLVALKPDEALNWLIRGQILEQLNRNPEALQAYEKATSIDPKNADAWQNKAGLQAKTDKLDDAIASFTKAIELAPGQPVFIYNRGCVYCRKGIKANALSDLSKAVSMNPQFKSYAAKDEDFKTLWDDEDFKKIIMQ
jgi:tetratricopeptide (TPR) repeat protein